MISCHGLVRSIALERWLAHFQSATWRIYWARSELCTFWLSPMPFHGCSSILAIRISTFYWRGLSGNSFGFLNLLILISWIFCFFKGLSVEWLVQVLYLFYHTFGKSFRFLGLIYCPTLSPICRCWKHCSLVCHGNSKRWVRVFNWKFKLSVEKLIFSNSCSIRGRLCSFSLFFRNVGTLLGYILGANVSYQHNAGICSFIPITFAIAFAMMPNTPRYYLERGQVKVRPQDNFEIDVCL